MASTAYHVDVISGAPGIRYVTWEPTAVKDAALAVSE